MPISRLLMSIKRHQIEPCTHELQNRLKWLDTNTKVSANGQKNTIDKLNKLKYDETMNVFRAVITLPKYTYDSRLKQMDTFETITSEVIVACMCAIPRIASTSRLLRREKWLCSALGMCRCVVAMGRCAYIYLRILSIIVANVFSQAYILITCMPSRISFMIFTRKSVRLAVCRRS